MTLLSDLQFWSTSLPLNCGQSRCRITELLLTHYYNCTCQSELEDIERGCLITYWEDTPSVFKLICLALSHFLLDWAHCFMWPSPSGLNKAKRHYKSAVRLLCTTGTDVPNNLLIHVCIRAFMLRQQLILMVLTCKMDIKNNLCPFCLMSKCHLTVNQRQKFHELFHQWQHTISSS